MTNFKEVKISEICDIEKWKSMYTKTFINENKGCFPVFSSQTINNWKIGEINTYDFNKKCITWTTDGIYAGTVFIRENISFSMTTHCWALFIKNKFNDWVYLKYLFNFLNINLRRFAIWDTNKRVTAWIIKNILIKIPIDKDWKFDLEKQKVIAKKYERIEEIKNKIKLIKEDFEEKVVKFEFKWKSKKVSIKEIFELGRWKSIYTREYWNNNKWDFPVYSAWKEKLTSINTFDFEWEYLTWATNWFAWYLKRLNWKFSLNADRWIFLPKTNFIDINFINYYIAIDLRNLTKWRIWDKWKNEFTKLSPKKIEDNIFINIPIDKNWNFDLEKQKEIAEKYEKIEKIKNNLILELEYLEKVKVEI